MRSWIRQLLVGGMIVFMCCAKAQSIEDACQHQTSTPSKSLKSETTTPCCNPTGSTADY